MDKETLKRVSIALTAALDRLGYTLDDKPTLSAFREMLTAYLRAHGPPPSRGEPEAFRTALVLGKPVNDGGKVYVSLNGLLTFMRRRWRGLTNKAAVKLLKGIGAKPKPIYVRRGGTALIGKRYWALPQELIPKPVKDAGKTAAAPQGGAALTQDLEVLAGVSLLDFLKTLEDLNTG